MDDDIEIQFRGGNPKKWHSGKMRIEGGRVTGHRPGWPHQVGAAQ
jgi:hypothetical protein